MTLGATLWCMTDPELNPPLPSQCSAELLETVAWGPDYPAILGCNNKNDTIDVLLSWADIDRLQDALADLQRRRRE